MKKISLINRLKLAIKQVFCTHDFKPIDATSGLGSEVIQECRKCKELIKSAQSID
jgi:hypothetical protein